jgi:hypothetical protein
MSIFLKNSRKCFFSIMLSIAILAMILQAIIVITTADAAGISLSENKGLTAVRPISGNMIS